ncbi:MAG TPA: hypothetical protein VNW15_04345 [Rhizomicrobium sp.]|jgi:hypothetical protein|nr:hypothetical protein [Rhizomicrobium sp.]
MPAKPIAYSMILASAVNNTGVLENCLQRSPDVAEGRLALRTYRDYRSASLAYNVALDELTEDVIAFAHQDVYLPAGSLTRIQNLLTELSVCDPDWVVCGVIGMNAAGATLGQTWCTANGRLLGPPVDTAVEIMTLDETLLLLRRASGVRFDAGLPSFHLYAADIIQTGIARGQKSYVLPVPIVHHSRAVVNLDAGYRAAYRHMQRKWRAVLPLHNLCCEIHHSDFYLIKEYLRHRWRHGFGPRPPEPKDNPALIARRLGWEPRA